MGAKGKEGKRRVLSEKERLIIDIVNDMVDVISEEQMDKLKLCLYKRISPISWSSKFESSETDIIKSFVINNLDFIG